MTPGTYLRLRREAYGLSIDEVAARLATEPSPDPEHLRAGTLSLIERDEAPASWSTIVALRCVFAFELEVLEALELARQGWPGGTLGVCRLCGCSDDDACPEGCSWAAPDLCSACVDPSAPADTTHTAPAHPAAQPEDDRP